MTRHPTTLHLAPAHVATDTRVFWKECVSLRDAGWRVTIVALHDRDEDLDGIRIVGLRRGKGSWGRLRNLAHVVRTILRNRTDVIHVHDIEILPVAIVLGLVGRKVIVDFHEDYPLLVESRSYIPKRLRRTAAWTVRLLEGLVVRVSSAVISAEDTGAQRFGKRHVAVLRNYVLDSEIELMARSEPDVRARACVYVGAVSRERGLLEMVGAIERAGSDIELRLIGEMPADLRAEVMATGGAQQLRYYGRCDRARTCEVLVGSAVGLVIWHPTPKHAGGAVPVKLFEYMAAGLPVIASDFPEIRAVVEPAGAGFLVDPFDVDALAAHMRWMVDHPEEARALGMRGRQSVLDRYTWSSQVPTLLGVYEALQELEP
ncbi:glycosyltransferase family 4 protein [Rhabdothermincola salaria]|uniref:glycosyltransferase family 4 protein n=1 Tax=Rhabdothermincola salaria TaxID=2903142 RepID=UPI001E2A526C|nr:glycosyltransferase family 4 protein [Rhabdothermincola salaria]MCD9622588.1 glycosyltransferase family 4 protein [Rhabdothermincola salaria]